MRLRGNLIALYSFPRRVVEREELSSSPWYPVPGSVESFKAESLEVQTGH